MSRTRALWSGRFKQPLDPDIADLTGSLRFDACLAPFDVVGSMAHARMLMETGIVEVGPSVRILQGLSGILTDLEEGELEPGGDAEDVHTWLENVLTDRIGPDGGRLHTARSRNDQTGLALRLWVRSGLEETLQLVERMIATWLASAHGHERTPMPGYTHLQRAQPVTLGHLLLAHGFALAADSERLLRCHALAGTSPLGAGALAGSPYPLRPERAAWLAGVERPFRNSLLAVADRDYVVEVLLAIALLQSHLARWAEEIVLWSTPEFGFLTLGDEVSQGSSLMPQKKNPEAAELIRGKAGRTVGNLTALLTTLKGLPFAYNSDLQEDKEPLFDSLATARASLRAARRISEGLTWNEEVMAAALERGHVTATALADYLVRCGLPFREAHETVGGWVRKAESKGIPLSGLTMEEMQDSCPQVDQAVRTVMDPLSSLERQDSPGGPSPASVARQAAILESELEDLRGWLQARHPAPVVAAHRAGTLWDLECPELTAASEEGSRESTRAGRSHTTDPD